ncbi:hypothetical protein BHM03_00056801 [Ensete ventricosum]|nr:hypothetical protein BHM03_00056801 [Ensete ventricosum]
MLALLAPSAPPSGATCPSSSRSTTMHPLSSKMCQPKRRHIVQPYTRRGLRLLVAPRAKSASRIDGGALRRSTPMSKASGILVSTMSRRPCPWKRRH